MNRNSIASTRIAYLRTLLLGWLLALTACASGPSMVDHAFGFDARMDSPGFLILDYRYGTSAMPSTTAERSIKNYGSSPQSGSINGGMPLGDTLYVKWQDKATEQVFEDTVNLKPLLPFSMYRKRIYFVVQRSRLNIYLSDLTSPKPYGTPIVGPFKIQSYITQQIYPSTLAK